MKNWDGARDRGEPILTKRKKEMGLTHAGISWEKKREIGGQSLTGNLACLCEATGRRTVGKKSRPEKGKRVSKRSEITVLSLTEDAQTIRGMARQ